MSKKPKMILAGNLTWKEFRDRLIKDLKSCKTKEDILMIIKKLCFSISFSEEEMQRKRRFFGIPET